MLKKIKRTESLEHTKMLWRWYKMQWKIWNCVMFGEFLIQIVNIHLAPETARNSLQTWFFLSVSIHTIAPCKGIRIPESRNFLPLESGILSFGIRNPALRIRNPTKDWNPESNLLKIHSRLNWATRSKEKPSVYGKPPEGIDLNVTT